MSLCSIISYYVVHNIMNVIFDIFVATGSIHNKISQNSQNHIKNKYEAGGTDRKVSFLQCAVQWCVMWGEKADLTVY